MVCTRRLCRWWRNSGNFCRKICSCAGRRIMRWATDELHKLWFCELNLTILEKELGFAFNMKVLDLSLSFPTPPRTPKSEVCSSGYGLPKEAMSVDGEFWKILQISAEKSRISSSLRNWLSRSVEGKYKRIGGGLISQQRSNIRKQKGEENKTTIGEELEGEERAKRRRSRGRNLKKRKETWKSKLNRYGVDV